MNAEREPCAALTLATVPRSDVLRSLALLLLLLHLLSGLGELSADQ